MEAKDFQQFTANRILELFKDKGQKRVLLADEVGLGKTIVARQVKVLVADWHREINDPHFDVIYICSNINIAEQNVDKLGTGEKFNAADSRLSMQSIRIWERKNKPRDKTKMPIMVTPLTPATSFTMTSGCGTQSERAFMCILLEGLEEFAHLKNELRDVLKQTAGKYWKWHLDYYNALIKWGKGGIKGLNYPDFYYLMKDELRKKLSAPARDGMLSNLLSFCTEKHNMRNSIECKWLINQYRKLFAEISLDYLDPDLVIMDEFQRFRDLLNDKDDEEHMLVRKFFNEDNDNMRILLLSATPYKPFTTLEELNETNVDEEYSDFFRLMDFLNAGSPTNGNFKTVWDSYSTELAQFTSNDFTVLVAKKKAAEEQMYDVICRTEKLNDAVFDFSKAQDVKVDTGDILSFCQMQQLIDACGKINEDHNKRARYRAVPMDYVKSSPYLMSFMDKYELKGYINRSLDGNLSNVFSQIPKGNQKLFLREQDIDRYEKIPANNARLKMLSDILFKNQAERLLWVPASHPYYECSGTVFNKNRDFSKLLVFSAWEMVPRMISVMLSYETQRLTVGRDQNRTHEEQTGGSITAEYLDLFIYPSKYLVDKYVPENNMGKKISVLRREVSRSIKQDLRTKGVHSSFRNSGVKAILNLLKYLDGETVELQPIPKSTAEILADMAIGSPAICMMRIFNRGKDFPEKTECCKEMGRNYASIFNRREGAAVIDLIYGQNSPGNFFYWNVFRYCVDGNTQSVLDEYAHTIGKVGKALFDEMDRGFMDASNLTVDVFDDNTVHKKSMRVQNAVSYANTNFTQKDLNRSVTVRTAFNSPFRPFVLASTSVGQEGLDFHLYCRKIVHWNLPTNPVDIEQREGRINRYECLAIRRNIAHAYGDRFFNWEDMFDQASLDFKGYHSDLVPYWCLPKEVEDIMKQRGIPYEKIERIVPLYPLSKDKSRYDRLCKVLSLYRLTLGQPRQEELVDLLDGKLTKEQQKELLIDLCPYRKGRL